MAKKKKLADPLLELLETAKPETLITLIAELAKDRPDVRRECFDFLKKHVSLTPAQKTRSEGEIVIALWWELYPDLEELDDCGGGDDGTPMRPSLICDLVRVSPSFSSQPEISSRRGIPAQMPALPVAC